MILMVVDLPALFHPVQFCIPVTIPVNYYNTVRMAVANFTDIHCEWRVLNCYGRTECCDDICAHYSPIQESMLYCNRSVILRSAGMNRRRVLMIKRFGMR